MKKYLLFGVLALIGCRSEDNQIVFNQAALTLQTYSCEVECEITESEQVLDVTLSDEAVLIIGEDAELTIGY